MTSRNPASTQYSLHPVALALALVVLLCPAGGRAQNANASQPWELVTTSDGSVPVARHETAAVALNGQIYLLGGRGLKSVDRYDPSSNTWSSLAPTPLEMHHFQPVVWQQKIYAVGGFRCCYPNEPSLTAIHIYDPLTDTWSVGDTIPEERRRGGAAAFVRNDRIYLVGGNTLGHNGGAVPWFDEYDPATGLWTELPDAPTSRDHFGAALIGDLLIAAGGRQTDLPDPFDKTIAAVDLFDFATGAWRTAPEPIPTQRAGTMVSIYGTEAIVIGGEVSGRKTALDEVEAFDSMTGQWRALQSMQQGRHSGGGVIIDEVLHVMTGSTATGGSGETSSHEKLDLNPEIPPLLDSDVDGLTDQDEVTLYGTDPFDPDVDSDGLNDGREIEMGTDPFNPDTDADGLSDGEEVNSYLSDPLMLDTDNDGLTDSDEVKVHGTKPFRADTDGDGLDDYAELVQGTSPVKADSDSDGLNDRVELNDTATNPLFADTDGDTLSDGFEVLEYGSDPLLIDTDSDDLDDALELTLGTNPRSNDTDADGLLDNDEIILHHTNPLLADTDSDGAPDALEIDLGFNPLIADSDGDGIGDFEEIQALSKKGSGNGGPFTLAILLIGLSIRRAQRGRGSPPNLYPLPPRIS